LTLCERRQWRFLSSDKLRRVVWRIISIPRSWKQLVSPVDICQSIKRHIPHKSNLEKRSLKIITLFTLTTAPKLHTYVSQKQQTPHGKCSRLRELRCEGKSSEVAVKGSHDLAETKVCVSALKLARCALHILASCCDSKDLTSTPSLPLQRPHKLSLI
jgi:hypothetical protein